MKTNHRPLDGKIPRLPVAPRGRFETWVNLALGVVVLAAVWHFQAALVDFAPRAAARGEYGSAAPDSLVRFESGLAPASDSLSRVVPTTATNHSTVDFGEPVRPEVTNSDS